MGWRSSLVSLIKFFALRSIVGKASVVDPLICQLVESWLEWVKRQEWNANTQKPDTQTYGLQCTVLSVGKLDVSISWFFVGCFFSFCSCGTKKGPEKKISLEKIKHRHLQWEISFKMFTPVFFFLHLVGRDPQGCERDVDKVWDTTLHSQSGSWGAEGYWPRSSRSFYRHRTYHFRRHQCCFMTSTLIEIFTQKFEPKCLQRCLLSVTSCQMNACIATFMLYFIGIDHSYVEYVFMVRVGLYEWRKVSHYFFFISFLFYGLSNINQAEDIVTKFVKVMCSSIYTVTSNCDCDY